MSALGHSCCLLTLAVVSTADQKQVTGLLLGTGVTWRVKARPALFGGDLPGAGRSNGRECNAPVLFLKYDSKIADRRMVVHCGACISIRERWVARKGTLLHRFLRFCLFWIDRLPIY